MSSETYSTVRRALAERLAALCREVGAANAFVADGRGALWGAAFDVPGSPDLALGLLSRAFANQQGKAFDQGGALRQVHRQHPPYFLAESFGTRLVLLVSFDAPFDPAPVRFVVQTAVGEIADLAERVREARGR